MYVKPSIKIAKLMFFINVAHLLQALNMNFNPYIYTLYYRSNLLNYLPPNPASYMYPYKICNGGVGTPREGSKLVNITSWRNVNDVTQMSINKESYWLTLTLLCLEARSRSYDISATNVGFILGNYTENVNIK